MTSHHAAWAVSAALLLACSSPLAAQPIKEQRLSFARGASSATVKGGIGGRDVMDYKVGASAGQTMTVTLKASRNACYFNVMPPGSDEALFIGSTLGYEWTGSLPAGGDYTIRVYLMSSSARRNEKATYTLTVGITGGPAGRAPANDAKVAGTPYHATGNVPCSSGAEAKGSKECAFGVIRGTSGHAEVHLTNPGGMKRVLAFAGDKVTIADPAVRLKAVKTGDTWSITINEAEFYQIPDAVVLGG